MLINAANPPATVTIALADRSYPIVIGTGLMADPLTYQHLPAASTALIVSNSTVAPLYLAQLQVALQGRFAKVVVCILPDGEAHKHWQCLQLIFDALLENHCDRQTILFANTQWKKRLGEYEAPELDEGLRDGLQDFIDRKKAEMADAWY